MLTGWIPKLRLPGETLAAVEVPVPESATVWGLPVALSEMLSSPVRVPLADGVKVRPIVQLAPAATAAPQLLAWEKSLALAPEIATVVIVSVALPEFVKVTICAALTIPTDTFPNAILGVERLTAAFAPVPESATVWGLPAALSATLRDAVRVPAAAGVKVTPIVQVAPAATLAPHVLVWVKSPALAPETAMPETSSEALPVLVRVTDRTVLDVETAWLPKERLLGAKVALVVAMVPERAMD